MTCRHCQTEVHTAARFCPSCGRLIRQEEVVQRMAADQQERAGLVSVFALYFLLLLTCVILKFAKLPATYNVLGTVELIFVLTVSFFALHNRAELKPLFGLKNVTWWHLLLIVLAAALSNIAISYLVELVNSFSDDVFYEYMYEDTTHPFLWSVLAIAVQPAIFEELTFRGIMYNHLQRVMEPSSVIIVTGFLFALLHLSIISIVWLIFFGIGMAWMRRCFGHLWYGMLFHFVFNFTYVLMEGRHRGWFDHWMN